jgi:hypothetical protein
MTNYSLLNKIGTALAAWNDMLDTCTQAGVKFNVTEFAAWPGANFGEGWEGEVRRNNDCRKVEGYNLIFEGEEKTPVARDTRFPEGGRSQTSAKR